ncbi:hypothetical protein CDCA_CDCA01G0181 [Cyanidium caldarium]|uniref:Uncharacterized protein n=1 Tax=Cyanidium caldarium TaxID=2771 RepID=A0AAV9IPM6_CYACA|nr:hypothetical protein CDCA_CDCA01G0181 [Cyanidium caldarium]
MSGKAAGEAARGVRRLVRRAIHPRRDYMRIVLANGATFRAPMAWLAPPPTADPSDPKRYDPVTKDFFVQADPYTHPAWRRNKDSSGSGT